MRLTANPEADGGEQRRRRLTSRVAAAAASRGVEVTPVSRSSRAPMARQGLQLGFAAVDRDEIRRGVRELAAALEAAGRVS
jgi:DNA-binding transcriptional MocR family regulator